MLLPFLQGFRVGWICLIRFSALPDDLPAQFMQRYGMGFPIPLRYIRACPLAVCFLRRVLCGRLVLILVADEFPHLNGDRECSFIPF